MQELNHNTTGDSETEWCWGLTPVIGGGALSVAVC